MNLYFLSDKNMDNATLNPRIPDNFLTRNNYEDNKTKRVCFCPTINKCLTALSMNCTDKEFYVHTPIDEYTNIYSPTIEEVPDCKITGEVWIKDPVKIKCIGKIKAHPTRGRGMKYTYGNNKSAELYDWSFEWLKEKVNESYYINDYDDTDVPDELRDSEYLDRMADSNCPGYIGLPKTEEELERQYDAYLSMHKDLRKIADNISRDIYDLSNEDRYRLFKSKFLSKDKPQEDLSDEFILSGSGGIYEEVEDFTKLDRSEINPITKDKIDAAIAFSNDTLWTIIYPVSSEEDLDILWDKFMSMTIKQRRMSDSKSLEIFGCTNQNMYELLKSKYLKRDVEHDIPIESDVVEIHYRPISSFEKLVERVSNMNIDTDRSNIISEVYSLNESEIKGAEKVLQTEFIKDVISKYRDNSLDTVDNTSMDLPYYDPIEISSLCQIDFSKPISHDDNFELSDGLFVSNWYNSYCLEFAGIKNQFFRDSMKSWVNFIRTESHRYNSNCLNENDLKKSEKKLKMVGWDPNREFDSVNRMTAAERTKLKMKSVDQTGSIVDLTSFKATSILSEGKKGKAFRRIYGAKDKMLYPIYIVLVEGSSIFSKAVKAYTHGTFSHAAIGFDSDLEDLYSFNMDSKFIKGINSSRKNGFSIEGVNKYDKDTKIGVYAIFVTEKEYNKMQAMIDFFMGSKTSYSITNLFKLVFNVPTKNSLNMICSQFVDNILKIADIDITKKTSNLVNPNDFFTIAKDNKRIYKVYYGACKDYKEDITLSLFDNMDKNKEIDYVKESTLITLIENADNIGYLKSLYESVGSDELMKEFNDVVVSPVCEIRAVYEEKEFPIQFNSEGDLLIKNISKIDFDAEYEITHKLLPVYEKSNNTEGIKYELCKLWFMSKLLTQRIKHKSFDWEKKINQDRRARILNDFNKYLKVVTNLEKDFNFTKYYHDTPFSDATITIKASTLKYSGEYLKRILKSL